MKKMFLVLGMFVTTAAFAQNEISWNYSIQKTGEKKYELHILATIQSPWHLYSQTNPEGGPIPTKISFVKNPLIVFNGKPKEVGELVKKHEAVFGIDVKYYEKKVEFIQSFQIKAKAKTNLGGAIQFMICNDHECLPPATEKFSVVVDD